MTPPTAGQKPVQALKALLLDNFDSFSYNLADEFRSRGVELQVYRNTVSVEELREVERQFPFSLLILSPGPGSPSTAGNLLPILKHFSATKTIFGVCLGHQALVEAFGGKVSRVAPVHGKPSPIELFPSKLFEGLPQVIKAARYHSLAGPAGTELPACLRETARTPASEGSINMALEHTSLPFYGVQFHPESILTPLGGVIIDNLLRLAAAHSAGVKP